ncbi:WD-40 repeat protein [Reticulomyxa filosa]|uniref:WD-40 repeat protein n=1 Tax=Reticulomyxa filosa TaxID=46433 RepID=X6MCN7_RETFI|nr:WD-40 repeat protein [Reticulomyxa filosa]|eukprot:ETO10805.1 WD-40 repeat protein [Reticulomyxa filosa]
MLSLCSGSWDASVKIWSWRPDGLSSVPLSSYSSSRSEIRCTVSSFLSPYIFGSGDESGNIFLYDTRINDAKSSEKGSHIRSISKAHEKEVTRLCWIPNKFEFVSVSTDGWIKHWDGDRGKLLAHQNTGEEFYCVSSDGTYVIAGGESGVVTMHSFDKNNKMRKISGNKNPLSRCDPSSRRVAITAMQMNVDGRYLAIGTKEFSDNILLYDLSQTKSSDVVQMYNSEHSSQKSNKNDKDKRNSGSMFSSMSDVDMFNASNLYKATAKNENFIRLRLCIFFSINFVFLKDLSILYRKKNLKNLVKCLSKEKLLKLFKNYDH